MAGNVQSSLRGTVVTVVHKVICTFSITGHESRGVIGEGKGVSCSYDTEHIFEGVRNFFYVVVVVGF